MFYKNGTVFSGIVILASVAVTACGGGGGSEDPVGVPVTVAKASCGTGDRAETGIQGQVPMAERASGFKGYNCNLQKTSASISSRGENVWEQFAIVHDKNGHTCGYAGPAFNTNPGTTVVDLTDPTKATETTILMTSAAQNPGEGLRINESRGLLVTAYYNGGTPSGLTQASGFDVYDVGTDCRHPQLLSTSTTISIPTDALRLAAGATQAWPRDDRLYGHEGAISSDGLTYWVGDWAHSAYHAIDVTDPTNPKYLTSFQFPDFGGAGQGNAHGLSISTDGNRIYPVTAALKLGQTTPTDGPWHNGFMVVDTSDIQARKPGGQARMVAEVVERDSSAQQTTIPVTIKGSKYLVSVPEAGHGNIAGVGAKAACAKGLTPFGMVHIYSMADEASPKLVSKLQLEVNDPKNCSLVAPEVDANQLWTYDSHMCTVDNRENATTLACGYFQAGIRVYDIRDPKSVKEIAYFVPPAAVAGQQPGWCAAMPFLDAKTASIYSRCTDSGVVALKFSNGVWPFQNSTTPTDKQL